MDYIRYLLFSTNYHCICTLLFHETRRQSGSSFWINTLRKVLQLSLLMMLNHFTRLWFRLSNLTRRRISSETNICLCMWQSSQSRTKQGGTTHHECGRQHSVPWDPGLNKVHLSTGMHHALLLDCRFSVTVSLKFLLPQPSFHDGPDWPMAALVGYFTTTVTNLPIATIYQACIHRKMELWHHCSHTVHKSFPKIR